MACLCQPHNLKICPVLALACYIFANPGIFCVSVDEEEGQLEDDHKREHKGCLFPGGNQYDCFMDCLHRIIGKYLAKFFALGISPGDLGSHSARKGASSHASSGTTVSPPMVSICLCMMWSMGHLKKR